MNSENSWETTMDPNNRNVFELNICQADEVVIFDGDIVEPRRDLC